VQVLLLVPAQRIFFGFAPLPRGSSGPELRPLVPWKVCFAWLAWVAGTNACARPPAGRRN